jgi:membrane fusion protein, multidrug efflux system
MATENREKTPPKEDIYRNGPPGLGNGEGNQRIESVPLFRKKRVIIPLFIIVIIAAIVGWYWYVNVRDFVSTDDAYIDADRVAISSDMPGRIVQLAAQEGDTVKRGQVLVVLDDSNLQAQEEQARAGLANAEQSVVLSRINQERAKEDYLRAEEQFKGKVISKEQYDHAQKTYDAARADYAIALSRVGTSKAQLGVVQTQRQHTMIAAPMDGAVAKKWVLVGDVVQPGQPIYSVYNTKDLWVTANVEETKLGHIHQNDPVEIAVDAYRGRSYHGKVLQVGGYTAAQFSLFPPNNASGNFTKVTQRVPIKISIEHASPENRSDASLLPGMSVEVKIKVK